MPEGRRKWASTKPCSVDGCERKIIARDLCNMHYQRLMSKGDVGGVLPRHIDYRDTVLGEGGRECTTCQTFKPWESFGPHAVGINGRRSKCKTCCALAAQARRQLDPERVNRSTKAWRDRQGPERLSAFGRKWNLRRIYGLSVEDFDEMLLRQNNLCPICGTDNPGGKGWVIDHCHATGKVRGVLCFRCNLALGQLGDDPARCEMAAFYLRSYNKGEPNGHP